MNSFNGTVVLPNNVAKTILELVQVAIANRTYGTQAQEDAAVNRFGSGSHITEGFIRPESDIYMVDAYKGVLNSSATAASWAAADFNVLSPGGGELLKTEVERHFNNGADLGTRVVFQASGGDVVIHVDISSQS